jgi:NAD(P)H-dependent flavin oxidoreductase YrpB (nitropropane dioxygenase family)
MPNNFKDIISRLEQQKVSIDAALAALREFEGGDTEITPRKVGRPAKAVKKATKKRSLSPEGRKRIADAARKRWAAVKKASKK